MVFNVGQLVAYISWQCSLVPGDIVARGSVSNLGRSSNPGGGLAPSATALLEPPRRRLRYSIRCWISDQETGKD